MGGRYFTVLCTLLRNGYRINTLVLINTEVNGFAFINTSFALKLSKFLNIKIIRIPKPLAIKDFDRKHVNTILYVLILYLTIDKRR